MFLQIINAMFAELILIREVHQKNVVFATIGLFQENWFNFQPYVCNGCHDLLMVSINLNDIAVNDIIVVMFLELAKVTL